MTSVVAMAGLTASSSTALQVGAPVSSSSSSSHKPGCLAVRANLQQESSRRGFLSLLVTAAPAVLIAQEAMAQTATSIKLQPPPPPSGGLPGTENADQARDGDLPLKERFYIQPLPVAEALARAKESAKDIIGVKALIDKRAWPYVQNDLRLKASYLRYDLNTVVSSKSKDVKKALKAVVAKLYGDISDLDYAARTKDVEKANKSYTNVVASLNDVFAQVG